MATSIFINLYLFPNLFTYQPRCKSKYEKQVAVVHFCVGSEVVSCKW